MKTFGGSEGEKEGDAFTAHLLLESLALKPSSVSLPLSPLRELGHAAAAAMRTSGCVFTTNLQDDGEKLAEF